MTRDKGPSIYRYLSLLTILAVSFSVYANTLRGGFVFDDGNQIVDNPWVKDPRHLYDIFTSHSFGFREDVPPITYRPLVFVVYTLEYALFGLKTWPWHLVNVIFHAANAVMVFFITFALLHKVESLRYGGGTPLTRHLPPLAAALIFAVHPVNSEAASWVGCVPELTYTLLLLAAFYLHIRAEGGASGTAVKVVTAVLYFAGILAKETAVVLPALLLVYDLCALRPRTLSASVALRRYSPYAAAFAAYMFIRFSVLGFVVPAEKMHSYLSGYQLLLNELVQLVHSLRMLLLPVYDPPFQLFRPVYSVLDPRAVLAVSFAAVALALILIFRKRLPPLYMLSFSFIVLPVLPTLLNVAVSRTPYADRYLYLSTVGFAFLLALVLKRALTYGVTHGKTALVRASVAAIVVALIGSSGWAAARSRIWKDDLSLWGAALDGGPDNHIAMQAVGSIYLKDGRTQDGIALFEESLRVNRAGEQPDYTMLVIAHKTLATQYEQLGLEGEAAREYREYVSLVPDDIVAIYRLANIYREQKLLDEAVALYRTALDYAAEPWQFRDIYLNLAESFASSGMWNDVVENYENALKYAPGDPFIIGNITRARAMAASGGG